MNPLPPNAVLLVVDVQKAFDNPAWGRRNNPAAETNIERLLATWRGAGRPVIHVHHRNPRAGSHFNPGAPGVVPKPEGRPLPGEPVLYKDVNSAFIGTDLEDRLRSARTAALVIVGLTTDHCISTTTRMAGNLGVTAYLVEDATATFDRTGPNGKSYSAELMHETALASLNGEFAEVVSTADIIGVLAASA